MKSINTQVNDNDKGDTLVNSLRYDSLFSSMEFIINSTDNLRIIELSALKHRDEIIPLDLINPKATHKKTYNKTHLLLSLTSILIGITLLSAAVATSQILIVAFAVFFGLFGLGVLAATHKSRIKIHQYKFINTKNTLFSLPESSNKKDQVTSFINKLNIRICHAHDNNMLNGTCEKIVNESGLKQLDILNEEKNYKQDKQAQYLVHLDFLFNHGIVGDDLYKILHSKINRRIESSENRFIEFQPDNTEDQKLPNNIIKFPVNA